MLSHVSKFINNPRLNSKQCIMFAKAMARYMKRGFKVTRALESLAESTDKKVAKTANRILAAIEDGQEVDVAFEQAGAFPPEMIAVIQASLGGAAAELYLELSNTLEYSADIKKSIFGLFAVPVGYTLALIGMAAFMAWTVLPNLSPMINGDFKGTAKFLMDSRTFLEEYSWGFFISIIVVVIGGARVLSKVPQIRIAIERRIFKIPGFGLLLLNMDVSRAAAYLSLLLAADDGAFSKTLKLTASTVSTLSVRMAILNWRQYIESGLDTQDAFLRSSDIWPREMLDVVSSGVGHGGLAEELKGYADLLRDELGDLLDFVKPKVNILSIIIAGVGSGWIFVDVLLGTILQSTTNL